MPTIAAPTSLANCTARTRLGLMFLLQIAAADGENEDHVTAFEPAAFQPVHEHAFPALVVHARGEFRDVVSRGVSLEAGDLAEIVHRVRRVGGTSAHAQEKQPPAPLANLGQLEYALLDRTRIQLGNDLRRFRKDSRS